MAFLYNIVSADIDAFLGPFGLSAGKFNILMVVKHQGGAQGLRQVEISERLILTPSNMTKLIDKLEAEGLVSRSSLEGDRRVNIVRITAKGSKLLDALWQGYAQRLKKSVAPLTKPEQKQLAALMTGWLERVV
jgi:DNA-binding MarR family transcriptional regulator